MAANLFLLLLIVSASDGFVPSSSSPRFAAATNLHGVSEENLSLLSPEGRSIVERLQADDAQAHVFAAWPARGKDDENKIRLVDQLLSLDRVSAHD